MTITTMKLIAESFFSITAQAVAKETCPHCLRQTVLDDFDNILYLFSSADDITDTDRDFWNTELVRLRDLPDLQEDDKETLEGIKSVLFTMNEIIAHKVYPSKPLTQTYNLGSKVHVWLDPEEEPLTVIITGLHGDTYTTEEITDEGPIYGELYLDDTNHKLATP